MAPFEPERDLDRDFDPLDRDLDSLSEPVLLSTGDTDLEFLPSDPDPDCALPERDLFVPTDLVLDRDALSFSIRDLLLGDSYL